MEKVRESFNPLVSIVIPIYNGTNYMREAIDSALAQTYKNIEVIVVNDGSTDSTEEIAKSYGDKIRYFAKENGGVSTALNLAIKNSRGEYISWLSHDDVYYPEKIERQIRKLSDLIKSDRDSTILASNYSLIDEKSNLFSIQEFHKTHDLNKLNYPLYLLLSGLVHGCTLLIPKNCFDDTGYFDEKLRTTQDYDLWFRMFPRYKMIFMPDLFVKSRWHEEQGSKKIKDANKEADELWIKMVKGLTDNQKVIIGGSSLGFYQKILKIINGAEYSGAERFITALIEENKNRDISKIKVSIIIPFFNRVNWTLEAIKSAVNQTHKNIEIILINDHSTDNLYEIEELVKSDSRIKLLVNKRKKGVSGARNTGIDESFGEYIAFLDSDDLFFPKKIEKQLLFMVRSGYMFSHTSYDLFGNLREHLKTVVSGKIDYVFPKIIAGCSIATPTVMLHKDLVISKDSRFLEDISIGEDVCFWIDLARISPCKGMVNRLTKVRSHGSNAAFDTEKQICGISNIFGYVVNRYLSAETDKYVLSLEQLLRHHLIAYTNKNRKYSYKKFDLAVMARLLKKSGKIFLNFISPTFYALQENKKRFILLENNLKNLEDVFQKK